MVTTVRKTTENYPAFEPLDRYPELSKLQKHWTVIRAEGIGIKDQMISPGDWRSEEDGWRILPLLLEREDEHLLPAALVASFRKLAPQTVQIVESLLSPESFAFSLVPPGKSIKPHRHGNPFVSASLCLEDGGRAYLIVDREMRRLKNGEMAVFDYRKPHAVYNWGSRDRLALIVALPLR